MPDRLWPALRASASRSTDSSPPDPNAPAAPPPPKKPEVQPRKNILGVWVFNKDESDDGRAKLKQSREADNSNRGNGTAVTAGRVWGAASRGWAEAHTEDRVHKAETFPTAWADRGESAARDENISEI